MPANSFHVAAYLQCLISEANSPSPVLNAVYSIDWALCLAGLPKVSDHAIVSSMVSASQRILGKPKAKKEPITSEMLKALVTCKISDKSPPLSDLRIVDLCLLGYAGFFRFSELYSIRACDIKFFPTYVSIFLESSKTDQFSIFIVRLAIFRNLIRPSPAGRTAPSMGLGFFPLCYRNERGEVFFNLWMLVGTVLV